MAQKEKEAKTIKERSGIGTGAILDIVRKKCGKESIMLYGEQRTSDIKVIPTGSYKLNNALGIGGVPRGRIIEIYGPESSGKTTASLQIVAAAQKMGGICGFVDAEHALDPTMGEGVGVDMASLLVSQPDNGEQALEIVELLVRTSELDVIVVDSVSALTPKAEIDGEMGDSHMGLQARLMSQALRKLTGAVAKSGTCVIFINQIRQKIGVTWGSNETTSGGNALKFYASVRLDVRAIGKIKKGSGDNADIIGNKLRIKVVKNKLAPPFKAAETELIFGRGFNMEGEIIDEACMLGIVEKSGNWYSYAGEKLCQGRTNLCEMLLEDKVLMSNLTAGVEKARKEGIIDEWA